MPPHLAFWGDDTIYRLPHAVEAAAMGQTHALIPSRRTVLELHYNVHYQLIYPTKRALMSPPTARPYLIKFP
jgi:hypothetical protein